MPDLQIQLWQQASRAASLGEAIARMAALLARRVPLDRLYVRHYDADASTLDTVAIGQVRTGPSPGAGHTSLSPAAAAAALAEAVHIVADGAAHPAVPEGLRGAVAVGRLADGDGRLLGALVAVLASGETLDATAAACLDASREPVAAALAHHLRLREMERLREAADSERRALLARLGRREIVDEIVGEASSLRGVMVRVEQVATTDAPVLLLGETGTGKEVVARAVHARSRRADGPIVRVNCGAIPPELIDSELFGHEKGSFTGAVAERKGWFERASGGTLFLDEIAELPPAAQVRLLRVLQDGTYERVGGQRTRTADVRLLAATHRDLEALVREGHFREDLWYRISVFPLYLPPLRARREDLPALVEHFARNAGLRFGGAPLAATPGDLERLAAYPWPGNVRELAAVVERAAILGGGHRLDLDGAMGTRQHALAERLDVPTPRDRPADADEPDDDLDLDRAMARHIERALRATAGRVEGPGGAAARLGVNPHTLRGRMRRLGVDWQRFRPA